MRVERELFLQKKHFSPSVCIQNLKRKNRLSSFLSLSLPFLFLSPNPLPAAVQALPRVHPGRRVLALRDLAESRIDVFSENDVCPVASLDRLHSVQLRVCHLGPLEDRVGEVGALEIHGLLSFFVRLF